MRFFFRRDSVCSFPLQSTFIAHSVFPHCRTNVLRRNWIVLRDKNRRSPFELTETAANWIGGLNARRCSGKMSAYRLLLTEMNTHGSADSIYNWNSRIICLFESIRTLQTLFNSLFNQVNTASPGNSFFAIDGQRMTHVLLAWLHMNL